MKKTTLNVQAIKNGTVIDHILSGQGLNILKHFKLDTLEKCVTVGFNLKSKSNQTKDLIKIEDIFFEDDEASQIALFSPNVTINTIKNYQVVSKITPKLPKEIQSIFKCVNDNCATHGEPIESSFKVIENLNKVKLKCLYCEKIFLLDWFI